MPTETYDRAAELSKVYFRYQETPHWLADELLQPDRVTELAVGEFGQALGSAFLAARVVEKEAPQLGQLIIASQLSLLRDRKKLFDFLNDLPETGESDVEPVIRHLYSAWANRAVADALLNETIDASGGEGDQAEIIDRRFLALTSERTAWEECIMAYRYRFSPGASVEDLLFQVEN